MALVLIYLYTGDYRFDRLARLLGNDARHKFPLDAIRHHVTVYDAAEEFMLPPLRRLAQVKTLEAIGTLWGSPKPRPSLVAALCHVYENTHQDDMSLRLTLTEHLIEQTRLVEGCPEVLEVVNRFEPIAYRIGVEAAKDKEIRDPSSMNNLEARFNLYLPEECKCPNCRKFCYGAWETTCCVKEVCQNCRARDSSMLQVN